MITLVVNFHPRLGCFRMYSLAGVVAIGFPTAYNPKGLGLRVPYTHTYIGSLGRRRGSNKTRNVEQVRKKSEKRRWVRPYALHQRGCALGCVLKEKTKKRRRRPSGDSAPLI